MVSVDSFEVFEDYLVLEKWYLSVLFVPFIELSEICVFN